MKKLTLAVVGLLLISVLPTLASADLGTKEFRGSIVIEDQEAFVSPLSFQPTGSPVIEGLYDLACANAAPVCDTADEDTGIGYDGRDTKDDEGAPTWIHVRGQDKEDYTVTLSSEAGPIVGTVDVYKHYPETGGNTPPCTTQLVTELYPEDGQSIASVGYLTKLRQVTLGSHAAIAAGVPAPVVDQELTLPPSDEGYIVVIDARAGTGLNGEVALDYAVTSPERFSANHVDNDWIQDPFTVVSSGQECLEYGVPIPPLDATLRGDIPGVGDVIGAQDLIGASLPEA